METKTKRCCCRKTKPAVNPADKYAGVATDRADGCRTSKKLVKEETAMLNNNPRNDDDKDQ